MQQKVKVPLQVEAEEFLPVYSTALASGADVRARLEKTLLLEPGAIATVPTGIRLAIPEGYEIQVRPRSGLAAKHGITVLNSPGTIDADYRGELCVILINHSKTTFSIEPSMRIAQIVLAPTFQAEFFQEKILVNTERGQGGFGHTGTK